jgi:hypothetical protein
MLRALLVLVVASGCIEDQLVVCADGLTTCPVGYVCVGDGRCTTSDLRCGDGFLANGETCDGAELGEATCQSEGFYGGELACTAECGFDLSACAGRCGDGMLDAVEQCDGSTATSCFELGSSFGRATCGSDCQPSTAPCLDLGWSVTYTADAPIESAVWVGDRYFLRLAGGDVVEVDNSGELQRWPQLLGTSAGQLAGTSATDVWLLTERQLSHYDGSTWTPVTDTGFQFFYLIAAVSPSRVVVNGVENGTLKIGVFDGTQWTRVTNNGGAKRIAISNDAVFAVDSAGLKIFDGVRWNTPAGSQNINDVTSDGVTTFAVGTQGFRVTNGELQPVDELKVEVERIHALGVDRFLAFTSLADAYEYDGMTWTRLRTPSVVSAAEITEAGLADDGTLTLASGQKLQRAELRMGDQAAQLLWAFDDAVWISRNQMVFRNDQLPDASSAPRAPAWGTLDPAEGDVVFVARNNGTTALAIDRCTEVGCQSQTIEPARIISMQGSSTTDVWALTDAPTKLLHFDGQAWSPVLAALPTLTDLAVAGRDDVYLVGPGSTIAHYDGQAFIFSNLGLPTETSFYDVRAFPNGRAFAVGTAGVFERVDGTWTHVLDPVSDLHVLGGTAPDDLYALGSLAMYHRDAAGWTQVQLPDLARTAQALHVTDDALWFDTVTSFSRLAPPPR